MRFDQSKRKPPGHRVARIFERRFAAVIDQNEFTLGRENVIQVQKLRPHHSMRIEHAHNQAQLHPVSSPVVSAIAYLSMTDYRSPTDHRLPITDYRLPITYYRLPPAVAPVSACNAAR